MGNQGLGGNSGRFWEEVGILCWILFSKHSMELLKIILTWFSILFFRGLDLYTTHLATSVDFSKQKQNFLVKNLNFPETEFFISESVFVLFLVLFYLLSKKKKMSFLRVNSLVACYNSDFNTSNLISSLKKLTLIFFSIIPQLYITTSCILAINNFAVLFISPR